MWRTVHDLSMDLVPDLRSLAAEQDGLFTASQAYRLGVTRRILRPWLNDGLCHLIIPGCYGIGPMPELDNVGGFRRRTQAALLTHPLAAASHHSALALAGVVLMCSDLRLIHLAQSARPSRAAMHLRFHRVPAGAVVHDQSVDLRTALIQHACLHGVECGVVALDHALHERRVSLTQVERRLAELPGRTGIARARLAVELADASAESPGESRLRLVLHRLGVPVRTQVIIRRPDGSFVGRVDMLVDEWIVVEFDGAVKYTDRSDLFREKQREDELRRLGYEVVRVVWADLGDPARIRERLEQARRRAGGAPASRW